MKNLTHKRLKELLSYNKDDGTFHWLETRSRVLSGSLAGHKRKSTGYVFIKIEENLYAAHRLAFLWVTGEYPRKGLHVDHINSIKHDNRWINLRAISPSENQHNRRDARVDGSSKKVGVTKIKSTGKYQSSIKENGKRHYLGNFETEDEASAAYQEAKLKYHPSAPTAIALEAIGAKDD